VTLVVGFAVTVALVLVSHSVYRHDEKRLLKARAMETESVLTVLVPIIQTPLASGAALADFTHGNLAKFRSYISSYVGISRMTPFISASLWKLDDVAAGPLTFVGLAPKLSVTSAASFFTASAHKGSLGITAMLNGPSPRVGYAFSSTGGYVAYAESGLPRNRYTPTQPSSGFSDINFAIYFGHSTALKELLSTSVRKLPLKRPTDTEVVPFGTGSFTLVVSARHPLSGSLPQRLPLIIALGGVLITLLAAGLTSVLVQRRRRAEHLAGELERIAAVNRQLFAQQRDIAQTLQHALLPEALPIIPGLETAAQYLAGEAGMEIGGDWYDLIPVSENKVMIVVGDVSGRGLKAAATMASLRFAIHAYAVQDDSPATILSKLSKLLSVSESGQLATILCASADLAGHELTLASAGHLPPLLVTDGQAEYVEGDVGTPIGVENDEGYRSTTVSVRPGTTLLAFTDGLIERRDETIDQGLARLQRVAVGNHIALTGLLDRVVKDLHNPPAQDDTAILGVRWTN
jgi:serine phosphatase RsbU (regulator of sigma subunit)